MKIKLNKLFTVLASLSFAFTSSVNFCGAMNDNNQKSTSTIEMTTIRPSYSIKIRIIDITKDSVSNEKVLYEGGIFPYECDKLPYPSYLRVFTCTQDVGDHPRECYYGVGHENNMRIYIGRCGEQLLHCDRAQLLDATVGEGVTPLKHHGIKLSCVKTMSNANGGRLHCLSCSQDEPFDGHIYLVILEPERDLVPQDKINSTIQELQNLLKKHDEVVNPAPVMENGNNNQNNQNDNEQIELGLFSFYYVMYPSQLR